MDSQGFRPVHWAEITAERIIKQCGEKEEYTLASGITPSGVVHFGNFREVITVDFVARALRARGKKVRFIFSWDDYDTFRKVPKNMPKQEELEKCLFRPIVDTPDPFAVHESYASHHENNFEKQLERVGVEVTPIYQAQKYRKGDYKEGIRKALHETSKIKEILNAHRTSPLDDSWLPVLVYCSSCNRDRIKSMSFSGDHILSYECELCGHKGEEDLDTTSRVKLPWRVDWPMRWAYEKVDFEPGGKDHSSQGGSYTTAKEIVDKIFGFKAPIYLQYDFVSIKGAGGKMSSSSGNLVTVNDVLNVYEPEMIRWIFASYKTNIDFAVSFDLDVIKTYEDFDRQERLAYGIEIGNDKKVTMAQRVFKLSQLNAHTEDLKPEEMPFQPSFRHLTNILQINDGDISKARESYISEIKNERDERRFTQRANCALFWLDNYAPEEFKFTINKEKVNIEISAQITEFLTKLKSTIVQDWESFQTDKDLHEKIYELIKEIGITPEDAFKTLYELLISKEKGPKLAGFIRTIGRDRVLNLL
ncbi:MAG: lysine--tRNA ligase [Halobacteriovoraceae bacterium]|nr:lysine--tRNA ligase [Halobacteriovoraceae bacterium]